MSEEEKQAIEKLKSIVKVNKDFLKGVENQTINQEEIKSIEIALNMIESLLWKEGNQKGLLKYKTDVIEKQQKEIEELKDKNKTLEMLLQGNLFEMYNYYKELANKYQANCISKDKIRELKEKVENEMISNPYDFSYMINELLGE